MPYRPYHTACDQLLGPDEPSIEAIKQKADETEDWRMCPNCHEFINGSGDITIRKSREAVVSSEEASEDGPPTAILTAGLLFGDESKGAFVDYLTSITRAHTVVRYSGGPQAAHRVVTPEGQQHVFSQFGSGTFLGAHTYLSRFMLVDPLRLITEAMHLRQQGVAEPLSMLAIDRRAVLVTPLHKLACQAREQARGDGRHGSCGMGIWEATAYARIYGDEGPTVADLGKPVDLHQKLYLLKDRLVKDLHLTDLRNLNAQASQLLSLDVDHLFQRYRDMDFIAYESLGRARIVGDEYLPERMQSGTTIFEGSQGVLLDENYGFHPHTTGTTTTFASADRLLQEAGFAGKVQRIGITRSYITRHGTARCRPRSRFLRWTSHTTRTTSGQAASASGRSISCCCATRSGCSAGSTGSPSATWTTGLVLAGWPPPTKPSRAMSSTCAAMARRFAAASPWTRAAPQRSGECGRSTARWIVRAAWVRSLWNTWKRRSSAWHRERRETIAAAGISNRSTDHYLLTRQKTRVAFSLCVPPSFEISSSRVAWPLSYSTEAICGVALRRARLPRKSASPIN